MEPKEQRARIQQAWNDVSAAGGGIVVLPEMYRVDRAVKRKNGRDIPQSYCLLAQDNVATWGSTSFFQACASFTTTLTIPPSMTRIRH